MSVIDFPEHFCVGRAANPCTGVRFPFLPQYLRAPASILCQKRAQNSVQMSTFSAAVVGGLAHLTGLVNASSTVIL